jgi:hypothetical protein
VAYYKFFISWDREGTDSVKAFYIMRTIQTLYRGADKSLLRPNSQCVLFDGENISFDASLVLYI